MNRREKTLIDALVDGALVIDRKGEVTEANGAAVDMLQSDPVGLAASSLIRSPAFAQAYGSVLRTREATDTDIEIHGRVPRQISAHIAPLGDTGEMFVQLRDLTREQALEKMRSDFVANASHEIRTPLSTIIGAIETLQGAAKNDAKAREIFLNSMLVQAQRMKRLIDDLLTLSRIELNEHVQPDDKVLLFNVASQAKANLAEQAASLNVSVEVAGTPHVAVAGNADELLQVAQNLIENAIKYGADGGRVEVQCRTLGNRGVLTVQDFGKGIAEVHLPRLTERFYRVNTQESRQRGGTGLGLAIVKHIVLRHRGKLDVTSHLDAGSTFTVSIPLYTPET
jgi:two-component system phosphate regulon sensor histidine kinase PhoR